MFDPTATAAPQSLAMGADGAIPEWIMLFPAGVINTVDGRGPYHVDDAAELCATSLARCGGRLPIDENHSTDLAAPKGGPSPARGWIVQMEARPNPNGTLAIWGRVEWTEAGRQLLADRAYRHISPVIIHDKKRVVSHILRAALTNTPNQRDMVALNQESTMDFMEQLCEALGLAKDADQTAVLTAVKGGMALQSALPPIAKAVGLPEVADQATVLATVTKLADGTALNAALGPIAEAAGLKRDADAPAVLQAVETLVDGASKDTKAVTALQAELAGVTGTLKTLQTSMATDKATAVVDGAIKAGKVGVKVLRDHYIARHAVDPQAVETEIAALPSLGPSGTLATPPAPSKDGKLALNAEQSSAAKLLGIAPEEYAKTLAAERAEQEVPA